MAGNPRVAVVGAGIAGLAAADALAERFDVTVIELSDQVGGKLRSGHLDGTRIEEGAESFLVRRPEAVSLAEDLGLTVVHPATASASVLIDGRLRRLPKGTQLGVPGDLFDLARSRVLTVSQLSRIAMDRLWPKGELSADCSVGEVVSSRMGPAVVERLVDPLLGGVYAGRADGISMAAAIPNLFAVMQTEKSLLAAAQSLHAGGASPDTPVFGSIEGGTQHLAISLAERVVERGGEIVLSTPVVSLGRNGRRWSVGFGGSNHLFDAVVLACPATPSGRLLAVMAPVATMLLTDIEYASVAIINLVYDAVTVQPPAGSGYLVVEEPGRIVKAVTFVTSKWGSQDPTRFVLRASVGRHGDTSALALTDDELIARVHTEVAPIAGLKAQPVASRVSRWGGALPQYAPGHLQRVAAIRAGLPDGVVVAGAAFDGVGIPACIGSGVSAAREVLRHLTHERSGRQTQGA